MKHDYELHIEISEGIVNLNSGAVSLEVIAHVATIQALSNLFHVYIKDNDS